MTLNTKHDISICFWKTIKIMKTCNFFIRRIIKKNIFKNKKTANFQLHYLKKKMQITIVSVFWTSSNIFLSNCLEFFPVSIFYNT